jgi:hypothetical protein
MTPALPRPAAPQRPAGRLPRLLFAFVLIANIHHLALGNGQKDLKILPGDPVSAQCRDLVRRLPNLTAAQCTEAALQPGPARSVQGRSILVRDLPAPDARLRVLVVGGIHGDELSSTSVALHWLGLAERGGFALPQPVHWRFIPALNPDGLIAQPPRRVNARGVDLNRNFPTPRWDHEAPLYWHKRTGKDPRRWPGPAPLSEPESRYLHDEMASFRPNLIVSVHAPFAVLDFDGPMTPPQRLGRLYLDQVGIYPGSLGNYGGVHKGIPVVTVELPHAQRTPLDAEMRQMWVDLLRWMGERLMNSPGLAQR